MHSIDSPFSPVQMYLIYTWGAIMTISSSSFSLKTSLCHHHSLHKSTFRRSNIATSLFLWASITPVINIIFIDCIVCATSSCTAYSFCFLSSVHVLVWIVLSLFSAIYTKDTKAFYFSSCDGYHCILVEELLTHEVVVVPFQSLLLPFFHIFYDPLSICIMSLYIAYWYTF